MGAMMGGSMRSWSRSYIYKLLTAFNNSCRRHFGVYVWYVEAGGGIKRFHSDRLKAHLLSLNLVLDQMESGGLCAHTCSLPGPLSGIVIPFCQISFNVLMSSHSDFSWPLAVPSVQIVSHLQKRWQHSAVRTDVLWLWIVHVVLREHHNQKRSIGVGRGSPSIFGEDGTGRMLCNSKYMFIHKGQRNFSCWSSGLAAQLFA